MRRNLWKKVTSATLCAAMVGGIMVSNGALAVQAEEGEEKRTETEAETPAKKTRSKKNTKEV